MNIYQKAIKVRKICESKIFCDGMDDCPYLENCKNSYAIDFAPQDESIEILAKAIKEEKWNVD